MKVICFFFVFIFLFCFGLARGQNSISIGNPFEKFDYDATKIATLSQGKYAEFHDEKHVVKIGSFLYNSRSKKITAIPEPEEKKDSEIVDKTEITSRFMSIDPLFKEYSHYSPYSFSGNKTIAFVELEGLEEFSIHTYSFSPFISFGGGYGGEGREYGDEIDLSDPSKANFKLGATARIDLANSQMIGEVTGYNTLSYHHYLPIEAESNTKIETQNYNSKNNQLDFHASSNNEAFFWGASPNIDVKANIKFTKLSDNIFNVSGTVTGDRFPANEIYLEDDLGYKVYLGVSGVDINWGIISPTFGPGRLLFGDDTSMSNFSFSVKYQIIRENTVFQSVLLSDGTEYSLNEWNEIFENLNPADSKTGTDISGNRIKTKTNEGG